MPAWPSWRRGTSVPASVPLRSRSVGGRRSMVRRSIASRRTSEAGTRTSSPSRRSRSSPRTGTSWTSRASWAITTRSAPTLRQRDPQPLAGPPLGGPRAVPSGDRGRGRARRQRAPGGRRHLAAAARGARLSSAVVLAAIGRHYFLDALAPARRVHARRALPMVCRSRNLRVPASYCSSCACGDATGPTWMGAAPEAFVR